MRWEDEQLGKGSKRAELKASVISSFFGFALAPGSEAHQRLSSYLPKTRSELLCLPKHLPKAPHLDYNSDFPFFPAHLGEFLSSSVKFRNRNTVTPKTIATVHLIELAVSSQIFSFKFIQQPI
ncbi:hypothetical protein HanRHA438_Chr11g0529871 [Helianthus annuus]|nr:hypothetical protein HanHA89_Chr11g0449301 [Helianthus annuus]KAJ0687488.1 hypothetical protein HanLR1_Chr11g0426601 [Helianthus annuus]KAJ0872980.1 hypothetical protein HanRHA438_Chr11g0529871 [Helianthus annuus]